MTSSAASRKDAADGVSQLQNGQDRLLKIDGSGCPTQPLQPADLEDLDGLCGQTAEPAGENLAGRRVGLAQREADAALRDALALTGFEGPDYDLFQHELARYGFQVMLAWIGNGTIFRYCAARGLRGLRSQPDEGSRLSSEEVDELAAETVARALPSFRRSALVDAGWTPGGGASLKTYFIGTCLYEFANTYRMWNRERQRWAHGAEAEALYIAQPRTTATPEDIVIAADEARRLLQQVPQERVRIVLALTADGYTHSEIADILADGSTPKAVEALLYRHRKALRGKEAPQR